MRPLYCQLGIAGYGEAGSTVITHGMYSSYAVQPEYTFGANTIRTGAMLTVAGNNLRHFSGAYINAERKFNLKSFPLSVTGFYLLNPFSSDMNEINWGLQLMWHNEHVQIRLGNNFRVYRFNKQAIDAYGFPANADTKIREPWNLMYAFTYSLKPADHQWNLSGTLCNYDHFLILQETNPMVNMKVSLRVSDQCSIYAEWWYRSAGLLNMHVNYYGTFLRIGGVWKLK